MPPLSPHRVDLWFAFQDAIRQTDLLAEYHRLLTDDERRQQQRFHFPKDRHRYLVTRALVRTVLSRYAAVDPADWRFYKNPHGRPEIANEGVRVSFNISHTDGLIVCGVTHARRALGVDTENIRTRSAAVEIADRFFSPRESTALRALPAGDQPERFFEYWVLKESYIKARGMGLAIPLRQFSFDLREAHRVYAAFHPPLDDGAARWRFWLFRPSAEHLAAVCLEQTADPPARLVMRKVVPLRSDAPLACTMLRDSDTAQRPQAERS